MFIVELFSLKIENIRKWIRLWEQSSRGFKSHYLCLNRGFVTQAREQKKLFYFFHFWLLKLNISFGKIFNCGTGRVHTNIFTSKTLTAESIRAHVCVEKHSALRFWYPSTSASQHVFQHGCLFSFNVQMAKYVWQIVCCGLCACEIYDGCVNADSNYKRVYHSSLELAD